MVFFISGKLKLLTALRFYATGSTSEVVGDMHGISKSSVLNIIYEVSYLICSKLKNRYIYMPNTEREILRSKAEFFRIANFPLCIACIDGTQIRSQSYGGDDAELYRNRKLYFSMNVQIACSANVSILSFYNCTISHLFNLLHYEGIIEWLLTKV